MANKRRRTPAPLKRRRHVAEPERRFYVYCEGRKTEPEYLRAVGYRFNHTSIVPVGVGGVPRTVVDRATAHAKELPQHRWRDRRATSSYEETDEVWVVLDRDNHPQFASAIAMCRARNVRVARSDPCFELWLVLHLENYDRPIDSAGIQARLHKLFPAYHHKHSPSPSFESLLDQLPEAEQRAAKQLEARAAQQRPLGNPSTTVGCLTRAIRQAHELAQRR